MKRTRIVLFLLMLICVSIVLASCGGVHSHDYNYTITKEASCEEDGVQTGVCSCGDTVYKSIPALGHDWQDATCTSLKECTRCNQKQGTTIDHQFGEWYITKEATCQEEGEECKKCVVCGFVETRMILITDHVYENGYCSVCGIKDENYHEHEWISATCETAKTCLTCGETEGEALGHKEVIDKAVDPDCVNTGLTEGKHCSVCNKVLVEQKVVPALGHKEVVDKAVAATCIASGLTQGKHCATCGEVLEEQKVIPALGHNYIEGVCGNCGAKDDEYHVHTWQEATCETAKTCLTCGATEGEALGHKEVIDKAVDPDCVNTGLTEGKHCSVCNKVLVEQKVVPALGHKEVVDKAVAATCIASGLTQGKHCSVCNEILEEQKVIPALGHKEVIDKAVAATCIASGLTEGKHCSVCNEILEEQKVIPALGHKEVIDKAVAATCIASGLTQGKHCSVCNEILEEQKVIPALGHNYVDGVCGNCGAKDDEYHVHTWQEATCETAKTCLTCGETEGEALGHKEVIDKAVAATCIASGLTQGKHCATCGEVLEEQKVIPALGHKEVIDKAVAATCIASGLTQGKHCSVCNEILEAQEVVPALGHKEVVDKAVAATCIASGLTQGKHCATCGEVLEGQEVVPALGHNFEITEKIEPTCTALGFTKYECSACGDSYFEQNNALGHNFKVSEVTEPSCVSSGYITYTCSNCGDSYTELNGEALGHTAGDPVVEDKIDADCVNSGSYYSAVYCLSCGTQISGEEVVIPAKGHSYDDSHICSVCGVEDSEHYFVMSIPEAIAAADGKKVAVTGTVCTINTIWTDENNNFSVTIIDGEGNQLYIYRLATKVSLGDIITVKGSMATYNGNRQVGQGGTATIDGHDANYDYAEMSIKEALNAPDNTNIIVSGIVVEIDVAYDPYYNNMSIYLSSDNGVRIYVYRLKGEVSNGDIITIKGSMGTYNGQRQITGGTFEKTGEHNCFDLASPTCQKGTYCKFCGKVVGEPYNHKDDDRNHLCDYDCGTVLIPPADSIMSIKEAIEIASLLAQNVFTPCKYYITGTITEIVSTTWGNMYIADDKGNEIYVYGFYNEDGSVRYDAMNPQPKVGDLVTVYAIIGFYDQIEIKNAWMTDYYPAVEGSVGLDYALNEDGVSYAVTGRGKCSDAELVIPAEYKGLPVTRIAVDAFWNDPVVTSVIMPDSVTVMESYAFTGCGNLVSIKLSNSLTTIIRRAFQGCENLASIEIPASVKVIETEAFRYCDKIDVIIIHNTLETIQDDAFYGADSITNAYYTGSEEDWLNITIGVNNEVFKHATMHYNYCPNGGTHSWKVATCVNPKTCVLCGTMQGETLAHTPGSGATCESAQICAVCKAEIAPALGHNEVITNAVEPTCLATGLTAGMKCSVCEKVLIKQEIVEALNHDMLDPTCAKPSTCSRCQYVAPDALANGHTFVGDNCSVCGAQKPSEGFVFTKDTDSFYGSYYKITKIGSCADTEVIIPDVYEGLPVKHIGYNVFVRSQITSIVIPDSIELIDAFAFNICSNLTELNIPASVISIDEEAIVSCSALERINVAEANPVYKSIDGVVYTKDGKTLVKYPMGKKDEVFSIPAGVMKIERYAFANTVNLKKVILPEGMTKVDAFAFNACASVEEIVLPSTIQEVLGLAFSYCTSLKTINLPEGLHTIHSSAFAHCSSLQEVHLPSTLLALGGSVFSNSGMKTFIMPNSVVEMGSNSFSNCPLTTVVIGTGIKYIDSNFNRTTTAMFYAGTEEQWANVILSSGNTALNNPPAFYSESQPTESGNFWHYVDGVPTLW